MTSAHTAIKSHYGYHSRPYVTIRRESSIQTVNAKNVVDLRRVKDQRMWNPEPFYTSILGYLAVVINSAIVCFFSALTR